MAHIGEEARFGRIQASQLFGLLPDEVVLRRQLALSLPLPVQADQQAGNQQER